MEYQNFVQQMTRLKTTFGKDNFSDEKIKLIWNEFRALPEKDAKRIVDWAIGEFSVQWPPKLSHFRESAEAVLKRIRSEETAKAAQNWNKSSDVRHPDGSGLNKALQELGAKSLVEAIRKTKQGS